MSCDQARLRSRLEKLGKTHRGDTRSAESLRRVSQDVEVSVKRRCEREARRPAVSFKDDLPVSLCREEIAQAIREHQVVIVAGETGSGKTTQLPKICLELGRGIGGMIGHTQPRRIAARSVAIRIAEELASPLGEAVGYKVRFSDHSHPNSYIKLMTDGILLAELQSDRNLSQYDTLIIDEAHERSLNIDFLLGYLKKLLPKRPDLRLVITSATIDTQRFSKHFNHAPVIEVSGRSYPVEICYRPLASEDESETDLISSILSAVDELAHLDRQGDILIFLSGERDIRDVAEALRKHHPTHTEILPLYSRLSTSEQNRIFQQSRFRRIVLATNVAETSLTVPGIRYVIDPGTARISRYSYRSKVQRLPIEKISRSSAAQRAGRCGRVSAGVCIRLYSEEDFQLRPEYTEPEIQRTSLASVILQMRVLSLGNPEEFPFIDPPDQRYVNDGFRLLCELGAIDENRQLTPVGRDLARLPIDPKIGRMVLAANTLHCLSEVLVIASALSIQDPRERPADKQQKADTQHAIFRDTDSDFISLLNLWREFQQQHKKLSNNQLRKYCRDHYLSFLRMKEWRETFQQLRSQVKNMGMNINPVDAEYAEIHQALLTGLLGNIGLRDDPDDSEKSKNKAGKKLRNYLGARNTLFNIFPGSALSKKTPRWIMSAELVETSRLFGRGNARIEPEWIEPVAMHLVKRCYTEPHWDERRGQVSVSETVTLYGLILSAGRRIDYGVINPNVSREIFIREALVRGRLRTRAVFHHHNQELISQVLLIEEKTRRRDVFAEEEALFHLFAELIPEDICSVPGFDRWRKREERKNPDILKLRKEDILAKSVNANAKDYPGELEVNGVTLPLMYCFNPGGEEDGVSVSVPLGALNQLQAEIFEWLVPGFLEEKVCAVLKGLAKSVRKRLVPVPDSARRIMENLNTTGHSPGDGLFASISAALRQDFGIQVTAAEMQDIELPTHLTMRFIVADHAQKMLASGRDLEQLQRVWGSQKSINPDISTLPSRWLQQGIHSWDFADLPRSLEVETPGGRYKVFPALVDHGDSVGVELLDSHDAADAAHAKGLLRLVMLTMPREIKTLRRNLPSIDTMCLQYSALGSCEEFKDDILDTAVAQCFLSDSEDIRSKKAFDSRLTENRSSLVEVSNSICKYLSQILSQFYALRNIPFSQITIIPEEIRADIQMQMDALVFKGFVVNTSVKRFEHIPRYLAGIQIRMEKLGVDIQTDALRQAKIKPFIARYHQLLELKKVNRQALQELRWMLEEYRISLFAQHLKTSIPVSPQRIENKIIACIE